MRHKKIEVLKKSYDNTGAGIYQALVEGGMGYDNVDLGKGGVVKHQKKKRSVEITSDNTFINFSREKKKYLIHRQNKNNN